MRVLIFSVTMRSLGHMSSTIRAMACSIRTSAPSTTPVPFNALADAVFYNALDLRPSYGSSQYATNVASWINAWFPRERHVHEPELNYARWFVGQLPSTGTHTGVLDLKCMTKIVSGVLVLARVEMRLRWTSKIDSGSRRLDHRSTSNGSQTKQNRAGGSCCDQVRHTHVLTLPLPLGVYYVRIYAMY